MESCENLSELSDELGESDDDDDFYSENNGKKHKR